MKRFPTGLAIVLAGLLLLIIDPLIAQAWEDISPWVLVILGALAFGSVWAGTSLMTWRSLPWYVAFGISLALAGLVLLFLGTLAKVAMHNILAPVGGACLIAAAILVIVIPFLRMIWRK